MSKAVVKPVAREALLLLPTSTREVRANQGDGRLLLEAVELLRSGETLWLIGKPPNAILAALAEQVEQGLASDADAARLPHPLSLSCMVCGYPQHAYRDQFRCFERDCSAGQRNRDAGLGLMIEARRCGSQVGCARED